MMKVIILTVLLLVCGAVSERNFDHTKETAKGGSDVNS